MDDNSQYDELASEQMFSAGSFTVTHGREGAISIHAGQSSASWYLTQR